MKIKTRFAPSPTGNLHIGSIRTALYSWLFARHHNGKFILRIEDTDLKRSDILSLNSILNGLKWLGLDWDEGPYFQSNRLCRYKEVIKLMLNKGDAYVCICSSESLLKLRNKQIKEGIKPRYPGICRNLKINHLLNKNYVIRFKNPLYGKVIFDDNIRGKIIFDNTELDDFIIQRSNGMPTYNFCVVIDDADMNITHVIRGEDHINNTPRQINILQSLGLKIPIYAHLSMILDEERQKISKRKNAINILEYRKNGFLPEALLNYIIRLGWSHGNQEIFNKEEMIKLFNLKSISKSSSIINTKKLLWMNKYYINHLSLNYISDTLCEYMKKENINIKNGPDLISVIKLFSGRYYTLKDMTKSFQYFYEEFSTFDKRIREEYFITDNCLILEKFHKKIASLFCWNCENISIVINNIIIEMKVQKKIVNTLLRIAMTGSTSSPCISSVIYLIGQKKTLSRIQRVISYINNL
ncbi:glutamate--tRNA ligase [Buchnera aphidicola (Macrosiphoniella sanborni)]|uniref:Glutamate--tRNA ligase n=1 Tax=Buchnera aphidicola (Macrosiphoniella sanborni) TaxID=1241865 RepID=A0A4D6YC63_9GAMM|nr:glutamate--tRNA ligase [Buchnera aphidicola]QCI23638.1 glutamate--tRNA ligase [Buchnera aphidicola (Macrosiphoniella sanborni)]